MSAASFSVRTYAITGIVAVTFAVIGLGALTGRHTHRSIAKVETELWEDRKRFRDLAECAADWFWETDEQHRFTFLSDRLRDVLGICPAEHIGLKRIEIDRTSKEAAAWDEHERVLAARTPFNGFEYDFWNGNEMRRIRISGKPVFGSSGEFRGYRGAGTDVTKQYQAAQTMREAKEAAEAANRSKSEFLANMSHELRTPLNAIIGFSEMIQAKAFGRVHAKYVEYAGDIANGGRHLLNLINEILDLSKVEAGRMHLDYEDIELQEEVRSCLRFLRDNAAAAEVELVNEVPDDLLPVDADRQRIRQILINLLSNAIKFSPKGGRVVVKAETLIGWALIRVRDHGCGIPEHKIATVLEPFGQTNTSLSRHTQGTGLGLALVDRFARLHGGAVRIDSIVGVGTCVSVAFPGAPTPDPVLGPQDQSNDHSSQ